jgi:TfoX/Sxy family transcriptional regulator of competence genes
LSALYDYYVKGHNQAFCLEYHSIARDKFDRADKILNRVAGEYEQLKADDFHTRNKKPRKKRVDPLSDTDMVLPE